jgi:large subunit ribosomal protein L32
MGALPKRKTSKARKGKRRSHHGLAAPALVECPQCHSPKLPHRVCPTCGSYAGREVIEIKTPKPKAT